MTLIGVNNDGTSQCHRVCARERREGRAATSSVSFLQGRDLAGKYQRVARRGAADDDGWAWTLSRNSTEEDTLLIGCRKLRRKSSLRHFEKQPISPKSQRRGGAAPLVSSSEVNYCCCYTQEHRDCIHSFSGGA